MNDDRRSGPDSAHSLGENPCGAGENRPYRNVTHIQSDAHPYETFETSGAGYVAKSCRAPANTRDRADSEPPRGHLNCEVFEQRRLESARDHRRERCRAAEDGKARPEQESQQMLLFRAKKRIGPHECDASRQRLPVEVWFSAPS